MGWIILGLLLLFSVIMLFVTTYKQEKTKKAKKDKINSKLKEHDAKESIEANHMAGLPIAEKALCSVYLCDDKVIVERNETKYTLSFDKVADVTIKTDSEIQKSYVSSVGGAVGGAVLFGPLGAMVGGRAKQKTSVNKEHYLIFTYNKEGAVDYISFDVTACYTKAQKFVDFFNTKPKEKKEVEL